ncbi:hypothetical protein FIV42_09430 [Persicimonas caeni]|uniref:Uncharacterized protein n=1 Tax=Persicimonas caeni TaxID=2292766 RepID=A0A4Y6PRK1_PERCE|nr:hypothetical protein [Persicimonas caeni]QDG50946.1 hypothetical protein FIV42_09430 [Persicimonas caeni]QED32167.1 hypothetical protein FRD00_09425 [Persicimonas caeni]
MSAFVMAGVSCADAEGSAQRVGETVGEARLHLAAAVPVDRDVARVRIDVYRCDSPEPVSSRRVGFTSASLDKLSGFEHKPVEFVRGHFFGRERWDLDAGCYYATAQPLGGNGEPLDGCAATQTTRVPLGPNTDHHFLLVARCGQMPSDVPMVDGALNFAPTVAELTTHRRTDRVEVCATARDPEGDHLRIRWSARTELGRATTAKPTSVQQIGKTLTECIALPRSILPVDVRATAVDGVEYASGAFASFEERRLRRFGIAAASRGQRTVRLEPASGRGCESPVEARTYWIRRDGRTLAPTDDLSMVRPGDVVEAEISVHGGCRDVHVELASFDGAERLFERDGGRRGPGTHILWVDVPEGDFEIALGIRVAGETRILDAGGSSTP